MTARAHTRGILAVLADLPLFLLGFGVFSVSMLLPSVHALIADDHSNARAFLYTSVLGIVLFALIATAMANRLVRQGPLGPLLSLFGVMVVMPVMLALPFYEALRTTTFLNAYVEMVSAITTTGAPVFGDVDRLSGSLHLWRAQVAWMGGFLMWTAAASILAPLNLGGFEVTARAEPGQARVTINQIRRADARTRLFRSIGALFPIYSGLTLLVWILLQISGDTSLTALIHAMGVMSTSGISNIGGVDFARSGVTGEIVILLFMVFAVSRLTFSTDTVTSKGGGLHTDPEIRLAVAIAVVVPILLFARHWIGAFDVDQQMSWVDGLRALWGGIFTVLSFLTTTGYSSAEWVTAQNWSGLGTPGLILMGLALVGGGVATTAGGVKLLRVFALYRHGLREMEQLVHPSSVSGARGMGRRLQKQGAFIAWVFFMLFALSLAAVCLALTAFGVGFEDAMVMAVAGLTNTGPLLSAATSDAITLAEIGAFPKLIFCAAMVIGRLETLAIIALLTPDLWRA